jgi:hypothetical protein
MITPIVKPDVLPDPVPGLAPSVPGYRRFPASNFVPRGGFANQITVEGQILDANKQPVAGSSYDAILYLLIDGIWRQAGKPVTNIAGGSGPQPALGSGRGYTSARVVSFLYGGIVDVAAEGYIQVVNIVPLTGVSMLFKVQSPEPSATVSRSLSGAPEVSLAPPATWKTLPTFVNAGALGPLVPVPTPVEQYVLLQADAGNPGQTVIVSQGIGSLSQGFELAAGKSIQWPTRDAGNIYILTDQAAGAITIRVTRF